MKKSLPPLTTDQEAEALLDKDMSAYLHMGNFHPASFEFLPKSEKVNLRVPAPLLAAIKKQAKRASMPYQRYIRQILEQAVLN